MLLTARSDEESRALGTQQGADAFLGKPFNDQELLATLRNLLALKDREREVEALNQRLAQEGLMRCLPPALVEGLMSGSMELDREPHGVSATLLVCSLQGFNTHTRSLQASRTARMLDAYLGAVSDAAFAHGATVDRFNGDEVVLIFGAPTQMSDPEQVRRAGLCALDIQAAVAGLRTAWEERKLPIPEVRIAIHQGTIMVGTFGGEQRTEYTAVGPNVARTQQLHRRCKAGQIWISRTATDRLPDSCTEEVGELSLCPAETPDMVFHLLPSSRLVLESFTSAA